MDSRQGRRRSLPGTGGEQTLSARWPARAQSLLESTLALCVDHLRQPLLTCVGQFGQQIFALADHARNFGEQAQLFTLRERVTQDHVAMEDRFFAHLTANFERIDSAASAAADGPEQAWQPLELLDPAEQELSSTLEQLGVRAESRYRDVLGELGFRMAVLVGAPPLEGEALPLGPHGLVQAFHAASSPLELPLEQQVQLLRSFDRGVLDALTALYAAVNAHLGDAGILPKLRRIPLSRHVASRPAAPVSEPAPNEAAAAHGSAVPSAPIEVLESLRNLLAQRRASVDTSAPHAVAERVASTEELQEALSALQQHLGQVTDQASRELRSAARLQEELLAQLNAGNSGNAPRAQLTGEQGDTVELVAMLFEQLGKQLQQGSSASNLLGNLQLPVLRMAVADHGFFEQPHHPARQLLDTAVAAANDWLDGSDDSATRLLASTLESMVTRAREEPPSNSLYTVLLADIEHQLGLLDRKARAAERRHIEAAQGRERLDTARRRAAELIAERFAASPPRGLLRALLDRAWSDVLALTLLRHGEDSEACAAQLAITDQLLGRVPIVDRLRLQQDVEAGLEQIGMHAEEALQVAQRLLGVPVGDAGTRQPSAADLALRLEQRQRLGETAGSDPHPAASTPVSAATSTPATTAVPAAVAAAAPATAEAAAGTTPAQPTDPRVALIERHLRQLPFGTWFEFDDAHGGASARRKLAWYSPMSGRCLLVTRRGQRGEEVTLVQLAQAIAAGGAREAPPVERGTLLDRAWRSLAGALRQTPVRADSIDGASR